MNGSDYDAILTMLDLSNTSVRSAPSQMKVSAVEEGKLLPRLADLLLTIPSYVSEENMDVLALGITKAIPRVYIDNQLPGSHRWKENEFTGPRGELTSVDR